MMNPVTKNRLLAIAASAAALAVGAEVARRVLRRRLIAGARGQLPSPALLRRLAAGPAQSLGPQPERHVPRVATPITATTLYHLLSQADSSLPREALLVLLAQSHFETGGWKACWNYNFGNVKHVRGDGHDFQTMTAPEVINGREVPVKDMMFVAFPTQEDGAAFYLSFLKNRFKNAWSSMLAGEPREFVQKLKTAGYFTGDERVYENNVNALFDAYQKVIRQDIA